ncbi:TLD domain-containing protein mustard isoform X3 [Dermacentor variabilis]|uniref:TLD domain-containing protein mustard isoform X3 n=1 Tax=Dermacentor variabilis TaxID=34621 RepID=UPI003F5C116F
MSSSGPTRQRSFRDRLHGIGLSWHNKTQSVDCHGYVNPLELVLDTSKKEDAGGRGGRSSGGPLEPLLGPLAAAAATQQQQQHRHPSSFHGGHSSVAGRRTAATSPGGAAAGRAVPSPPLPPAPHSAPPTTTAASSDAGVGRKQLSRTPTQPPPGAIEYVVKASDTLAGIAARFECTPGELTTMNRLTSRLIFPGQTLYIPIKEQDAADAPEHGRLEDDKAFAGHHGTGAGPPLLGERPCSPRAIVSPPDSPVAFVEQQRHGGSSTEHIELAEPENKENMDMFLKISSRHITDGQGVVMGTLLVTPNNVMFVPNVSDALVMEHGSECYEVTAPMDMVVAAALYNDITHMRLRDTVDPASGVQLEEPYRPADYQPPPKDQSSSSGKSSEPTKSSQECTTEVSPSLSMQEAGEKPCFELSHSECTLEELVSDQITSAVIVTSPPKTPEKGVPPTGQTGSEMPGSAAKTENKAPTCVLSDVLGAKCEQPKAVQDAVSVASVVKSENWEQMLQQSMTCDLQLGIDTQKPEVVAESTEQSRAQLESKDTCSLEKPLHSEPQKEVCAVQVKSSGSKVAGAVSGKAESGVRQGAVEQLAADVAPAPEAQEKTAKVFTEVSKQQEAAAGEAGTGESNKVVPHGAQLEVELSSATAQVVKDDRAGDKLVAQDIAALMNVQEKLPPDMVTAQKKILSAEESVATTKKEERQNTEYLFKPIDKAFESPPTRRREPDNVGRREKAFTPPPPSSGGKSLPEPARWPRMLSPTLKLDSTSDVPAPEPYSASSTESITLRMREWASVEGGVSSDRAQESAHERVLKRLSNPMESISSYTHSISKMIASSPKSLADFVRGADEPAPPTPPLQPQMQQPAVDEKRPSSHTENANVWLKNMVEEKPELFAAFEKLGFIFDDNELVPRLAQSSEATLLYLCLRMGRPLHKKVQCSVTTSSKRHIRPQYWFGVPRNRADELYYFLEKWAPSVYGDVHRVDMASRGFEPLPEPADEDEAELLIANSHVMGTISGTEEGRDTPDISGSSKGHHGSKKGHGGALRFFKIFDSGTAQPEAAAVSPGDWEVVSMSETRRESPLDLTDLPLPELLDSTEIFTEEHRRELCKHLPARAESYSWALVYSTLKHGFSLKTLYREMLKIESPILLAVLDTEGAVFGVLTSCSLRMSDHFYGTGESFLFTFHPEFKLYKWTGENGYFIKGNADSLAFGAGDGQFGLWLDGDLFHGRSRRCKTYENDILSTKEDFVVKALEAWGFV